jgi:hypothetical protein
MGFSMSHTSAVILMFVMGWVIPGFSQDAYPLREAVECHPRSGLPNFRTKVEAGKTVKIAYLGGSITAAPGWRVQSRE